MPLEIPVLLLYNLDPKWSASEQEEVIDYTLRACEALNNAGYPTTLVPVTNDDLGEFLNKYDPLEYIVFNWCEDLPGVPHGESLVAEYLEQHGFTFTGASSATLALTSDKHRVKRLLDNAGVSTPEWQTFDKSSGVNWNRFPAIVKPSKQHCSEGINFCAVVTTETLLKNRIRYITKRFQQPALVADFISGRELHVTLWGNTKIEMLPPAEMDFSLIKDEYKRICTYESKFLAGSKQYQSINTLIPAPLSKSEYDQIRELCQAAYALLDGCDYARFDVRMKEGTFFIVDVNPNADLCFDTSTILAAESAGYTYGDFLGALVKLAAERHPLWRNSSVFS